MLERFSVKDSKIVPTTMDPSIQSIEGSGTYFFVNTTRTDASFPATSLFVNSQPILAQRFEMKQNVFCSICTVLLITVFNAGKLEE